MDLRNVCTLPQHYTTSQPRRPRLETAPQRKWQNSRRCHWAVTHLAWTTTSVVDVFVIFLSSSRRLLPPASFQIHLYSSTVRKLTFQSTLHKFWHFCSWMADCETTRLWKTENLKCVFFFFFLFFFFFFFFFFCPSDRLSACLYRLRVGP